MKKFNDKIQELLNSILKKSPSNENDININEISDNAYIDDVFAKTATSLDACRLNPNACKTTFDP